MGLEGVRWGCCAVFLVWDFFFFSCVVFCCFFFFFFPFVAVGFWCFVGKERVFGGGVSFFGCWRWVFLVGFLRFLALELRCCGGKIAVEAVFFGSGSLSGSVIVRFP